MGGGGRTRRIRLNPEIPADPGETGRWLLGFAVAHAKRVDPRVEVTLETTGDAYHLRLGLGPGAASPTGSPLIALTDAEVREGRSRLTWCEVLGERLRAEARALLVAASPA